MAFVVFSETDRPAEEVVVEDPDGRVAACFPHPGEVRLSVWKDARGPGIVRPLLAPTPAVGRCVAIAFIQAGLVRLRDGEALGVTVRAFADEADACRQGWASACPQPCVACDAAFADGVAAWQECMDTRDREVAERGEPNPAPDLLRSAYAAWAWCPPPGKEVVWSECLRRCGLPAGHVHNDRDGNPVHP